MNLPADSHLIHWLILFGQNIAMGMVVVAVYATLRALVQDKRSRLRPIFVGALFGLSAIASMSFPVQLAEGLRGDLRIVFVLIGGLFGGPTGAVIATAIPTLFRIYLGGNGAIAGTAAIVSAGLIGFLFARYAKKRQSEFGIAMLLVAGLTNAAISIMWVSLVFALKGSAGPPLEADEALVLLCPLANVILGTSMILTHPRGWRQTERQLADIVATTADLVWELDAAGRFTYASDRYVDLFEVAIKDIIGKTVTELGWHAVDPATEQAFEAAWAEQRPFRNISFVQSKKSGDPRLISVTGRPLFDERSRFVGYRGTATDITEREKWRSLMATISAKVGSAVGDDYFRTLVRTVAEVLSVDNAYIGRFDHAAGMVLGLYLYYGGNVDPGPNLSFAGMPSGVVAGGKSLIVSAGIKDRFPQLASLASFAGVQAYAAVPLVSARGEVLGILSVADTRLWEAPEYIETVLSLFAGRAAAEIERTIVDEEREGSRRKMAEVVAALDVARDAIILIDGDGKIVYHNRSAVELMGLPKGIISALGKRLTEWSVDPRFSQIGDGVLSTLSTAGEWRGSGPWIRPDDGRTIIFDAHARALPTGGAVIVATDATARVKFEEEERRQQRREAQASKLEALGNLAGGIAHDFNNLLGAVLGFGQFLLEDLDPASAQHRYAERIVSVSQRGRSLVQQILTFSRSTIVEPTTVVLKETIAEIYELLRVTLPATTQLVIDNRAEDATIIADKGQLVQVLVNLCVNGSDALADEPGTIKISVARLDRNRSELSRLAPAQGKPSPAYVETWRETDGTVCVATGAIPQGDCLSLTVADTGLGISDSILGQMFEPFRTTKGVGRGTGLGLAVVHRIVREHGGAILVRTRSNHGTCFEILLDTNANSADTLREQLLEFVPSVAVVASASILVVDDDKDYCAMVQTALTRLGHTVETTNDPRVALGWVRHGARNWDILVTDQTMPYIRGGDLVRGFKAVSANTRCIICTGYSSGMSEQQAIAAGADGFILKPFDVGQLANLVATLVKPESVSKSTEQSRAGPI